LATARQAIGARIGADHLALHTKCGGLQRDKVDIPESIAIDAFAEHVGRTLACDDADESK